MKNIALLNKKSPSIIKNGDSLDVKIISHEIIPIEQVIKSTVHDTIGDENIFENIGKGDQRIKIKFYFDTLEDYDSFINFISGGNSLLLAVNFFPLTTPVNILGNIETDRYYEGWGIATVNFTTAKNPYDDPNALINFGISSLTSKLGETVGNKASLLDSMRNFASDTFDFVSNANTAIGGITNTISVYSAAITNIAQGLASSSSIITTPISSIKNSVSQVTGGLSSIITAMQNVVFAIKQLPSDVDGMIDTFSQLGDQLNDLFDLGDSNTNLQYNTDFLQDVGNALINVDVTPDAVTISESSDIQNGQFTAAEYFLTTVTARNSEVISLLALASILINLYENAENIDRWSKPDLDRLLTTTEAIYVYLNTIDMPPDLSLQIDLARSRFFKLFKILYARSINLVIVNVTVPTYLEDIVYSVNGNFDYFEETKKLNNIVGSFVYDTISVISND